MLVRFTVNVADLMPASSPCWMSSTSASKPSRSAHRVYMRSSISAQSWLSVPPAPALIVAIASDASYGPESSAASSSFPTSASSELTAACELERRARVGSVGEQLIHGDGVVDPGHQRVVAIDLALQPGELRRDLPGLAAGSSHSDGSEASASQALRPVRVCRRRQRNSFAASTRSRSFCRRSVCSLIATGMVAATRCAPVRPIPRTRPRSPGDQTVAPWHFLYFLPLPHGQGALRGILSLTA